MHQQPRPRALTWSVFRGNAFEPQEFARLSDGEIKQGKALLVSTAAILTQLCEIRKGEKPEAQVAGSRSCPSLRFTLTKAHVQDDATNPNNL